MINKSSIEKIIKSHLFWLVVFGFVFLFWPSQHAFAYSNTCDKPTHVVNSGDMTSENVSCGTNFSVPQIYYLLIPSDTVSVTTTARTSTESVFVEREDNGGQVWPPNGQLCGSFYCTPLPSVWPEYYTPGNYVAVILGGTGGSGGSVTFNLTYNNPPPTAPTATITANDSHNVTIPYNTSVSISWSSTGGTCVIQGHGNGSGTWTDTSGTVSQGAFTSAANYTITCTNSAGVQASDIAYITVNSPQPPVLAAPAPSCGNLADSPTFTLTWTPTSGSDIVYRSIQNSNNWDTKVPHSSPFTDGGVANGTKYSYKIVVGSVESSTLNVSATCSVSLSAVISPTIKTIALGTPAVTYSITSPLLNIAKTINGTTTNSYQTILPTALRTVGWSADATTGSLVPNPSIISQASFTTTAGSTIGNHTITAPITYALPNSHIISAVPIPSATITIVAALPATQIKGDTYSGGSVGSLTFDSNSVVSAFGTVGAVDSTGQPVKYQIPGYTTSNALKWETVGSVKGAKDTMLAEAAKLVSEHVDKNKTTRVLGVNPGNYIISGTFNLNPPAGATPSTSGNNSSSPEGTVWYVPGDLTINATVFSGRGTLIVDGNVTVNGNMSYAKASDGLGIILTGSGSVTFNAGTSDFPVRNIVGAYFVPNGSITFSPAADANNPAQLTASGLFVGNTIQLQRKSINISYDQNIIKATPPGFGTLSLPTVQDATQ